MQEHLIKAPETDGSKKVLNIAAGIGFTVTVFVAGWCFGAGNISANTNTLSPVSLSATATPAAVGAVKATSPISLPMLTLGANPSAQPGSIDASQFWHTWNLLNQNFVQTRASSTIPTDADKMNAAIAGLVNSYNDPYTVYMPPTDAQMFNQNVTGNFGGVGMEIGNDKDGNLVVIAPLKGNPAEAAGILSGDKIIAIDATSSPHMSSDEAVKMIRGIIGTTVKITVMRAGETTPRIIPIVRANIVVPNIKTSYNPGTGVFEIDLYSFSAVSADNFRDALKEYFKSGATKMLLDLRGNPGGYLNAAVEIGSYFLPAGAPIVTEDYEGKQTNIVHRSLGYNIFANKKLSMAILTDQGTASAAEILSGALQQNGIATLVGTRTFGKGCVQEVFDLGGGAQVKVTVARWLTPNGTNISDGGLTPDVNATTTREQVLAGHDPQKEAAISWLSTH